MNENALRRDLAPFADPATDLSIVSGETASKVSIVRDGRALRLQISSSDGSVVLHSTETAESARFSNLASLLASSWFADIRAFVQHQQRTLAAKLGAQPVISTTFEVSGGAMTLLDAIAHIRESASRETTTIFAVDGPAGIGKTHFLERLAQEQADSFLRGERATPVLHVSSRGSRLSNLRDVLAKTTQLVRARFRFEEVPVLARYGLLIIAIDGFDELVDADGYKDAWFALQDFLDEVRPGGAVMLAGRDTFFDQQGFYERLNYSRAAVIVKNIHIQSVAPDVARSWLLDKAWPEKDIDSELTSSVLRSGSYALRPYFLLQLATISGWGELVGRTLRETLIATFIAREAKILNELVPVDDETLQTKLREIYRNVALDMAERQSDTVDMEYLALLCEVAFQSLLASEDVRKIKHKIGSVALLERDASPALRRFPHDEVLFYFLSEGLVEELLANRIPTALRNGVLSADFLETYSEEIQTKAESSVTRLIMTLKGILARETGQDRLGLNVGALAITSLARPLAGVPTELSDIATTDACLISAAPLAVLRDVTISKLDAREAQFSGVKLVNTTVMALTIDSITRFGNSLPNVHMLRVESPAGTQIVRDPDEIRRILTGRMPSVDVQVTAAPQSSLPHDRNPLLRLLDQACRRMNRYHAIREGAEDDGGFLLRDPLWPELEALLSEAHRIDRYTKPMRRPAATLVRIRNPLQLLQPSASDAESTALRDRIAARGRALEH